MNKICNQVLSLPIGTDLTLNVVILKIIFFNSDNYYYVCECRDTNGFIFVATGKFPTLLHEGQSYEFTGTTVFQRGQKQLNVTKYKNIIPFDRNAMILYLSTLPGIKSKAIAIYQAYGPNSLKMLRENPMQVVKEIKGIGKITAIRCKEALDQMMLSEDSIIKLLEYGLTPTAARKLYDIYNDKINEKIEANPYFLIKEVKGYGFKKCDAIAEQIGFDFKSPERLREGIKYTLELSQSDGHCYLPRAELVEKAADLLSKRLSVSTMKHLLDNKKDSYLYGKKIYKINLEELAKAYDLETNTKHFGKDLRYKFLTITPSEIETVLQTLIKDYEVVIDSNNVYLTKIFKAERYVEKKISEMSKYRKDLKANADEIIQRLEFKNRCLLEPEQKSAIETFLSYDGGAFTLTGSAGCGKTFTVKFLIEAMRTLNYNLKIGLFAPTGKAAKVLHNATGYECKTIHRGLEYHPELGFQKNENNPLDYNVIIVDETSMLDIELLYHFLRAVKTTTKIIFLGDVNQLQSVGCGNVLADLMRSPAVISAKLTTIKRQGLESGIVVNANNIINNKDINNDYLDFILYTDENEKNIMDELISHYQNLLEAGITIDDIQILTPQKNNTFGTYNLNRIIQDIVNKNTSLEIPYKTVNDFTLSFREGDKVIHTKNNYDKEWFEFTATGYEPIGEFGIFNGDCGIVESIYINPATNKKEMFVKYDNLYIRYVGDDIEELELAYALTIHKSQGSEWTHVLIPMLRQHYVMLNMHLLYTAITRAKDNCALFAQLSAIKTAIKTSTLKSRYSNLNIK